MKIYSVIYVLVLLTLTQPKCAYTQPDQGLPYVYNGDAFPINYTMSACMEYIGDDVCCNEANARLTNDNLKQIDGVFSTASGGCDICAINLKRFWCEYACSPRQADFLKVSTKYYEYPDPQRPGKTIIAQEANLTVEANTACAIFNSCKRVPFVASVTAMGSPAGFLNFQGHNAIDNALQYISVEFTYDPTKGLYLNNATGKPKTYEPTMCNYSEPDLHGYQVSQSCSCNSCEQSCDNTVGFKYEEASLWQGFNLPLVLGMYGGVTLVAGALTVYRWRRQKVRHEQ